MYDLYLQPETRLEIYKQLEKWILELLASDDGAIPIKSHYTLTYHMGLCSLINKGFSLDVYEDSDFERFLPELWAKRPAASFTTFRNGGYWYMCSDVGWKKRLVLVQQAIHDLALTIKHQ